MNAYPNNVNAAPRIVIPTKYFFMSPGLPGGLAHGDGRDFGSRLGGVPVAVL